VNLKRREREGGGDIENGKIDTETWTKLANSIGVELHPKTKESSSNCCSGHHVGFAIAALLSFSYLLVVQELLGTCIHTYIYTYYHCKTSYFPNLLMTLFLFF